MILLSGIADIVLDSFDFFSTEYAYFYGISSPSYGDFTFYVIIHNFNLKVASFEVLNRIIHWIEVEPYLSR